MGAEENPKPQFETSEVEHEKESSDTKTIVQRKRKHENNRNKRKAGAVRACLSERVCQSATILSKTVCDWPVWLPCALAQNPLQRRVHLEPVCSVQAQGDFRNTSASQRRFTDEFGRI
uniref:Uncharacterized protein n=1 Tax=Knipowitschia caucasica TaxID=637954 RepID=A0AAV2LBI1_KNICA